MGVEEAFKPDFVYLDKSGAKFLADRKIKSIGIDYLGIERNQIGHESHIFLLENNIPIIEGLRLASLTGELGILYCLPINLVGVEAAFARAIIYIK